MKTVAPVESQRLPAFIVCDGQSGGLKVAGLTALDRLVVAMHRAGADSITIVTTEDPVFLERTTALGITVRTVPELPRLPGPVLVAASGLIVQVADLREVIRRQGQLVTAQGERLPIGVLSHVDADWRTALDSLPAIRAEGPAGCVTDGRSARALERALWASLTSSADGLVDRVFNRPCGRILSKLLVQTSMSPNAVSLVSIAIGVVAAWLFAPGTYPAIVAAAIVFQLSAIVDCVDGDLARILYKESKLGKWLDLVGDQVVHISVFAGIAIGLARHGDPTIASWLGISAVVGALLSFAVVVRGMRQNACGRGELMQTLIDSVTNRDFSVLVLALALFNRLEWFLWLAAIGSHLFWIAALGLQLAPPGKRETAR